MCEYGEGGDCDEECSMEVAAECELCKILYFDFSEREDRFCQSSILYLQIQNDDSTYNI